MNDAFTMAVIPLFMTGALAYYAYRLLYLHDASCLRPKDAKKLKDPAGYTKDAGRLMVFLCIASVLMLVLLYVNVQAALAEIIICLLIFGVLWKKLYDKYEG